MMLRTLDIFSGIGGFSLGLERTGGFRTVAFCEIDPFCRKVLAKHWPEVPIYEDVRTLTADALSRDGIAVDVICGGFPCQDVSFAGKRVGLEGERSGLWGEYRRLIGEIRPRFVIVENVPGLLSLGMGTVCGDLASLGFDAVWDCVPASAVGAPHRRDRVWIVAHAAERRRQGVSNGHAKPSHALPSGPATDASGVEYGLQSLSGRECKDAAIAQHDGATQPMANANLSGASEERIQPGRQEGAGGERQSGYWDFEPAICRVADGVPDRLERLTALGGAVVPQIPEMIGRAILQAA